MENEAPIVTFETRKGRNFRIRFHLNSVMQGILFGLVLLALFIVPLLIFHIEL